MAADATIADGSGDVPARTYDFVIVGAGSAGCVLADRLSADGRFSVLVIEAGGSDRKLSIKVPLGYAYAHRDPKLNWGYRTAPDPGLAGREIDWPRGRVLGGSGSINAMAYVRGLPHDFDDWEAAGATGWSWDAVRTTYEHLEGQTGATRAGPAPLRIARADDRMHPFADTFLRAATELGWPSPQDMNSPGAEGLSYFRSTLHKGTRWSTADAFLRPALRRATLRLVTNATVEKITLRDGRARGVIYRAQGQRCVAQANREIILCAGAVNSPQILQLSGIGPPDLLGRLGIGVAHPLSEVGQGLQDHLAISHCFAATEPTLNGWLGTRAGRVLSGLSYALARKGPLSVPINQVGGFVRSDPSCPAPDVQIYCNPASYQATDHGPPKVDAEPGFLLSAQPCRPTSRGSIRIRSADPGTPPLIQPNSLSTQADIQGAVTACRTLHRLAAAPAIAQAIRHCKDPDLASMTDDEMLDNFRSRATTNYHPCCTCRMGADPATSVLDARLRVHGVRGLRVVDASAFPNIPSGNTNAPTIMLASRAAGLILEETNAAI